MRADARGCAPIVLESGGFGSSLLEIEGLLVVHYMGSDGGGLEG